MPGCPSGLSAPPCWGRFFCEVVGEGDAWPIVFIKKPRVARGSLFYLRSPEPGPVGVSVDPLGERLGMRVFPEAFLALLVAVEPVVPVTLPVVFTDEPVAVPLIPVEGTPVVCASANVLESAKVVASAIVVSFISFPSCRFEYRQLHRRFYRSLNYSLSAPEGFSHLTEP